LHGWVRVGVQSAGEGHLLGFEAVGETNLSDLHDHYELHLYSFVGVGVCLGVVSDHEEAYQKESGGEKGD
jgi:hypothetical protein